MVLRVVDRRGCADTIIKAVTVNPPFSLYVPDAFSPNKDGVNDMFMPVCSGLCQYTLRVFNRWGMLIFESNDSAGWDGTYKTAVCPPDVYAWTVVARFADGKTEKRTGYVVLVD